MSASSSELGVLVRTGAFDTNVHLHGSGAPVLLIHGSGPGVSAWANWRLVMPELARSRRVIAPDMVGFGLTDRPAGMRYTMDTWVQQALDLLDALDIERADVVGNSFGGALALALAIRAPQRVRRLVLMGSVGVPFEITEGLNAVWGYTPSVENMRRIMDVFAHDRSLVTDELARLRYEASIRPGHPGGLRRDVPGAAPALGGCDGQPRGGDPRPAAPDAAGARPRGPGDPARDLADARAMDSRQPAPRVRALRPLDADRAHRALQPPREGLPR
jgi:pimeloyl-ACP methyl ester carboxylesterase